MTLEEYYNICVNGFVEFTYDDGKYFIGMYYLTDGGVTCCSSANDAGVVIKNAEKALDEFIIGNKSLREILPELDVNLIY